MIEILIFVVFLLICLVLYEWRARKKANDKRQETTNEEVESSQPEPTDDSGCCGEHLVCERETLLQTNGEIIYYDDEELDALANTEAEDYTEEEAEQIREVFRTLRESDVPGWVRSLQLRNIQLPEDVKEEVLLIVRERRKR